MWGVAYCLLLVAVLLASEPPAALRTVAPPYLATTLFALEHAAVPEAGRLAALEHSLLRTHGLLVSAGLAAAVRVARVLALLCGRAAAAQALDTLAVWPLYAMQGVLAHFLLVLLARRAGGDPAACLAATAAATAAVLLLHWGVLHRERGWRRMYRRATLVCLAGGAAACGWLAAVAHGDGLRESAAAAVVAGVAPPVLAAAVVAALLCGGTGDAAGEAGGGGVQLELNRL